MHERYRGSKVNRTALLRAHNEYVLQLQNANAMTEEFYGNETIHIMKDLDEIDASASNVFGESIEMFVASTINFAMHQKLRYEAVQRDECPQLMCVSTPRNLFSCAKQRLDASIRSGVSAEPCSTSVHLLC